MSEQHLKCLRLPTFHAIHRHRANVAEPGHVLIDVVRLSRTDGEEGRCYIFTARDPHSGWNFKKTVGRATPAIACGFLNDLVKNGPFKVRSVSTDGSVLFVGRHEAAQGARHGKHDGFHSLCERQGIKHIINPPTAPWLKL